MKRLLIKGGMLITPTEERFCDLLLEDDKIASLGCPYPEKDLEILQLNGEYVTPGLFDMQVNGGAECDFWEGLSLQKLRAFSSRMLAAGLTSILPTLITGDSVLVKANRDFLKQYLGLESSRKSGLFRMPGIHLEGPFLSPQKPGVHPVEHLQELKLDALKDLADDSCSLITLAPELEPEGTCLEYLRQTKTLVSIGHSNASLEEARLSFDRGVQMMTHTFNALPPLHHRNPGAVAAALLDSRVSCALIPDGLHLLAEVAALILKCKGVESTVLVSDMAAVGTSQGGLVGSSLLLSDGVRNMVNWKVATFQQAIRMASYNPAKLLGLENKIACIKEGAFADLLIWDRHTLEIKSVIFGGNMLRETLSV